MQTALMLIMIFLVVVFIAGSFLVVHALASLIGAVAGRADARRRRPKPSRQVTRLT